MSISSHLFGKRPIVTLVLAALMAASFGYVSMYADRSDDQADDALTRARAFYEHNPGVHVSARDRSLLGAAFVDVIAETYAREDAAGSAPRFSKRMKARSQERFEGLTQTAFEERMDAFPAWRHGVASHGTPLQNFVAYTFVHESALALGVSLAFFVVAGIGLEGAYGSLLFGLFCLLGVLVPGLVFQGMGTGGIPLSGASGLVSTMLGAYLVRGLGGRFAIPGWLLLSAWAFVEVIFVRGIWIESLASAPIAPHLAGLGLGAVAALALRFSNVESTIADLADPAADVANSSALARAQVALAQSNPEVALEALREGFEQAPGDEDVAIAYWNLAREHGQAEAARAAILPIIRERVRGGAVAEALDYWNQLVLVGDDFEIEPTVSVRIGEALLDEGQPEAALEALGRAIDGGQRVGSALAQRIVRVARDLDETLTQRAAAIALEDPHLDPNSRIELESLAADIHATAPRLASEPTVGIPSSTAAPGAGASPSPAESSPQAQTSARSASNSRSASNHEATQFPIESDIDLDNTEDLMAEDVYEELTLGQAPDGRSVAADPEDIDPNALSIQSIEREFAGDLDLDLDGSPDLTGPDTAEWNVPGHIGDLSAGPEVEAPALLDSSADTGAYVDNSHLEAGALSSAAMSEAPAAPPPAPELQLSAAEETTEDLDIGLGLRTIKCVEGVPVGLKETAIEMEIDGRGASKVPFDRIDAVAIAAVSGLSQKPVLVIDLVLNWTSSTDEPLKVIRLCSNRFNPVRIVTGAQSPVAALRDLVALILEKGGGAPLPDSGLISGGGFASFPDLSSYQRKVLGAED